MQLHKGDVLAKALSILDAYGIADLTMRRLARELDVTPGALYWHFTSKQQLLGALADEVLRPVCAPPTTEPWPVRMTDIGLRLRDALLSHTDGAELVSASVAAGQSAAADAVIGLLTDASSDAGLPPPQDSLAARTVLYYVLGFTVDEQSRLQLDSAGATDVAVDLTTDPTARFEFGLRLLIDGVAVQHDLPESTNSSR